MNESVRKFRVRRAERMGLKKETEFDRNPVARYYERRYNRLKARFDDDEENNSNGNGGGHGNTRIPFGLCQREGITVEPDWTPKDAWNALEGKGYKPSQVYKELQETGKVTGKSSSKPKMSTEEADKAIKDYKKALSVLSKARSKEESAYIEFKQAERDKRFIVANIDRNKEKLKEYLDKWGTEENIPREKNQRRYGSFGDFVSEYDHYMETKANMEANERRLTEVDGKLPKIEEDYFKAKKKLDELTGESKVKEREESKTRYREAIKTKYPTYKDCPTTSELLDRVEIEDYFSPASTDKVKATFGKLGIDDAVAIANDLEAFFEKNPKLRGKLGTFVCKRMKKYGGLSRDDHVELSTDYFSVRKHDHHIPKGMHPETDSWGRQALFHEYSHQMDLYLSKKMGMMDYGFSSIVYKEVVKRLKESGDELVTGLEEKIPRRIKGEREREEFLNNLIKQRVKSSVSEYAYKWGRSVHAHDREFLAEAYAGFLDNKNPSKVEKLVGEIVTEYLDKLED